MPLCEDTHPKPDSVSPPLQPLSESSQSMSCCGERTSSRPVAMDYIASVGMTTEWKMPYTSYFGTPPGGQVCRYNASIPQLATVHIGGWEKLTPNSHDEVITALATIGPLAVNVQANTWSDYESGVFTGCSNLSDVDIDHVVQLVGYGFDAALNRSYFLVRNSWDTTWGEEGYIRLSAERTCGTDPTPLDGTGCAGGAPHSRQDGQGRYPYTETRLRTS